MKIYTKAGDKGRTSLFGGTMVHKDNVRIEAYGTIDELNSFVGLLISHLKEKEIEAELKSIQSVLFDIGSHLASDGKADKHLPALDEGWITRLEEEIDKMTEKLPSLRSFILPGGNTRIAVVHLCRTVCRRAERRVISLDTHKTISEFIKIFLNRLSDYFFVLARFLCHLDGVDEIKWNPKRS